ncbi:MAG: D-alanine--poly(phosphoribitol) ligase subunit DltC [Verrucomicrobiota bacterium]|jgi:D-alanine--poly(phosphoribitol) ligase subunit 2
MSTTEHVLRMVTRIGELDEVIQNLELRLYDVGILDSLKTVELMVALSAEFGVEISPAEFEREQWATPRNIIAYMEQKLGQAVPANAVRTS